MTENKRDEAIITVDSFMKIDAPIIALNVDDSPVNQ